MTQENARNACADLRGFLVDYKDIVYSNHSAEYISQLSDGETAWLDSYVRLSPFIARIGCYRVKNETDDDNDDKYLLEKQSLFDCIRICVQRTPKVNRTQNMYLGISRLSCYCLNIMDINKLPIVKDSLCDTKCSNFTLDTCGGQNLVSLYRVYHEIRLRWASNEPSKQCVYVKKRRKTYKAYTSSCFLNLANVNGYLCTNSTSLRRASRCVSNLTDNCEIELVSTRQTAVEDCQDNSGRLSGLYDNIHAPTANRTYWIGEYRTFKIVQKKKWPNDYNICLAVVKLDQKVYLEADNCSIKKKNICRDVIHTLDADSSGGGESYIVYIGIGIGAAAIICFVVVTVIILCYRHTTQRSKNNMVVSYENTRESNGEYVHPY